MRHFYKTALLAGVLVLSGCASAAMGHPHRNGMGESQTERGHEEENDDEEPMMGMTPLVGCHGARGDVDTRLASLRTALQITAAQDGLWSAYAEAFRAHASHMGAGMMGAGGEAAPPPIVDRLRHHETMMSQHLASFRALRAAIEALYASFGAEQRAAADAMRCERPS